MLAFMRRFSEMVNKPRQSFKQSKIQPSIQVHVVKFLESSVYIEIMQKPLCVYIKRNLNLGQDNDK